MYPNTKRNHKLIRIGNIKSRHSSTKKYKVYIDYSEFEMNQKFKFLCDCFQGNRTCQPCVHIMACFFVIWTYQRGKSLSQYKSIFAMRPSSAFLDCKNYKDWLKDTNYSGYCVCKKLSYQEIRYFRNYQTKKKRNTNARKRFEKLKNRFAAQESDSDSNANENDNNNNTNDNSNNENDFEDDTNDNDNDNSQDINSNSQLQASQDNQDAGEIEIDINSLIGCKLCCNVWHIACIEMTDEEAKEARDNNWRCPFRCNKDTTEVIDIEGRMNKLRHITPNNLFQRIRHRTARAPRNEQSANPESDGKENEMKQDDIQHQHNCNARYGKAEISFEESSDEEIGNMNDNHNHNLNINDINNNEGSLSEHSSDDEVLEGMPTNMGIEMKDTNDVSVSTGSSNVDIDYNHNNNDHMNVQDNDCFLEIDWLTGKLYESEVEDEDISKYIDDMNPPPTKKRRTAR